MKLVSFNIWGGSVYNPLMDYLRHESADTDIFCFQEVFSALPPAPKVSAGSRMFLFEELGEMLKDFYGLYEPRSEGCDFNGPVNFSASHGLAMFVKKILPVINYRGRLIAAVSEAADHLVKAQVLKLSLADKDCHIINFHGIAQPGTKLDTPERILQSQKLSGIWNGLGDAPKILCGDFNLMPETKSVGLLEALGTNLIKEYKISNTRNDISWKRFNNRQYFADYCFTSRQVKVLDFQVPYNEFSDHLPMILKFEL